MNNQHTPLPLSMTDAYQSGHEDTQKIVQNPLPPHGLQETSFWRERCIEGGLIISLVLYYFCCNKNLQFGIFTDQNPLYSLPFLLIFAVLCWYRLSIALALLPLTLPYYLTAYQKIVVSDKAFSLVEVMLATCVLVAALRFLLLKEERRLWRGLWAKIGPFLLPIGVFVLATVIASVLAVSKKAAYYALTEEVIGPLLYLVLVLVYLRTRHDIQRLLAAFIGTGVVITILGLAQYYIFKLPVDPEGSRVHAVYGSGNNIGTLFDYILPLLLALLIGRRIAWQYRLLAFVISVPMSYVLYLSQSRGAWLAIVCAIVFIAICSIRNRKIMLIGGTILAVVLVIVLLLFHNKLFSFLEKGHVSSTGQSTLMKRPYLWLTAVHMIEDNPWMGYGMDNWLCYYSNNTLCKAPVKHFWVTVDPITHKPTGLKDEPTLSHPHNIFLQVWVSAGFFGFLAFAAVLVLFYWLFARILAQIRVSGEQEKERQLHWLIIGIGAAIGAALVQGQVDSTFLEQDLAFCFWALVAALLVVRLQAGVAWRGQQPVDTTGIADMK
jgi:putative inorganic carbon (HCO3(-)) transporter